MKKVIPMKLSLFGSRNVPEHTLILPLKKHGDQQANSQKDTKDCSEHSSWKRQFCKLRNWFLRDDENYGSERFLCKARKILIRLKKAKEAERKQKELNKAITNMEEQRKKFEYLRNDTYRDQFQNMEAKLDLLISNLTTQND